MPIVLNPASELAKELRKWEQHHTQYSMDEHGSSTPGNPYAFRPYPKMLYRAQIRNGKIVCLDAPPQPALFPDDKTYERAVLANEAFNQGCYRVVKDDAEERRARDEGWRVTIAEAIAHREAIEQDIAQAAAEANFAVQRMSEKARAEHAAADAATEHHVTDIAGKKRGPKAVTPSAQE